MKSSSILFLIVLISLGISGKKLDYAKFKATQDYTVPLFEDAFDKKVALFIFPHADDEIVCAGTIATLKQMGWEVNLLTLNQGLYSAKAIRKKEWENAVAALELDHAEILDFPNNTWENVMRDSIVFWYDHQDSVATIFEKAIQQYKPSVLFTYDMELGAYGHPEHRISAEIAHKVFQKHKGDPNFPVQRIFQITLPEAMEQLMLSDSESYHNAIQRTGNKTLPEPTVAFDISRFWPMKRNAAAKYASQEGSMKKFYLLPAVKDTAVHYKTFDREYYHEVSR
ncbi:MAG: PIG-L family deacetylase [Bacteroidetes bacterium]|nr:PIG-L family deacetylase [Bacteroidota bacterium]